MDIQSINPFLHGVRFPGLLPYYFFDHELGGLFTHVANPTFAAPHA